MRTSASVLLVASAVLLDGRGARAETRLGAFAGPAVFAHRGRLGENHIGPAAGLAVDFSLTERLGLSFRPGYYEKGESGWDASYLGSPVLLRYPTRPGPYLVAGGEANLLVSDSWVGKVDVALTAGLGASWGEGRWRGFFEGRFSWSLADGPDGIAAHPAFDGRAAQPGKGPSQDRAPAGRAMTVVGAEAPPYRGVVFVVGVTFGLN